MSDELATGKIPVEPTADQRGFARTLYATYVALIEANFNDTQAMTVITAMVTGALAPNQG